jgi:hypothetical protein
MILPTFNLLNINHKKTTLSGWFFVFENYQTFICNLWLRFELLSPQDVLVQRDGIVTNPTTNSPLCIPGLRTLKSSASETQNDRSKNIILSPNAKD